MAGGDKIGVQVAGALHEGSELELLIAEHARIWGASDLVFIGEIPNDLALEVGRFIDQVERDTQPMANTASIGHGLRTTAFVLGAGDAVLGPEFEGNAHDVVPALEQESGRRGGVHHHSFFPVFSH